MKRVKEIHFFFNWRSETTERLALSLLISLFTPRWSVLASTESILFLRHFLLLKHNSLPFSVWTLGHFGGFSPIMAVLALCMHLRILSLPWDLIPLLAGRNRLASDVKSGVVPCRKRSFLVYMYCASIMMWRIFRKNYSPPSTSSSPFSSHSRSPYSIHSGPYLRCLPRTRSSFRCCFRFRSCSCPHFRYCPPSCLRQSPNARPRPRPRSRFLLSGTRI